MMASGQTIGLHGSEYWTYFLPQRVGNRMADALTEGCAPILAEDAQRIGLVDDVIASKVDDFYAALQQRVYELLEAPAPGLVQQLVFAKKTQRTVDWFQQLEHHRQNELRRMARDFQSPEYLGLVEAFVRKQYAEKRLGYDDVPLWIKTAHDPPKVAPAVRDFAKGKREEYSDFIRRQYGCLLSPLPPLTLPSPSAHGVPAAVPDHLLLAHVPHTSLDNEVLVIDGKVLAANLRRSIRDDVAAFRKQFGRAPGLAVVLVGEQADSLVYTEQAAGGAQGGHGRAQRGAAGGDHAGGAARRSLGAQRGPGRGRHPGAAAAARPPPRAGGDRGN